MRKFFTALVVIPVAVVFLIFAVANRRMVTVSFDPFNSADPSLGVTLPLFISNAYGLGDSYSFQQGNQSISTRSFRCAGHGPARDPGYAGGREGAAMVHVMGHRSRPKNQTPPAHGFWSLTLYSEHHSSRPMN